MTIQDIIEIIKETLEKDERVKICHKFQADKALQIQLIDGKSFNLNVIELDSKTYIIKRDVSKPTE